MAQLAILDKIERSARNYGLTIVSRTATTIVVDNASNDFTVSLVDATIGAPMGGVDPAVSPFLGIGVAAPCILKMKSTVHAADTVADLFDTVAAVTLFRILCGFANDVLLENGDAGYSVRVRGNPDIVGLGQ
jgi:hypothetical protein